MGIFKSSIITGGKFKISELSNTNSVSVYDVERYLQCQNDYNVIKKVNILFVEDKEVIAQWIELRDRRWWEAFKNTCGFEVQGEKDKD